MFVRAGSEAGKEFVVVLKILAVMVVVCVVMAFLVASVVESTAVVFICEEVAKSCVLSIAVSGAVEKVSTLGTVVTLTPRVVGLSLAGVLMSVTPVITLVIFASVEFLVLVGMVGRARVRVAGGCVVLRVPVSAVRDTLPAVVVPGVLIGGGVEMTRVVLCTEVAFVVVVTVVMPGVVFASSGVVLFKMLVVAESMPVDAVLAVVVLTGPGLRTCVDVRVVWLTARAAVVAERRVVSCVMSVVPAGKETRLRGLETGVSVSVAVATADAGSVVLSVPAVVPSVIRLFTELVVTGEVPLPRFAEVSSVVFMVLREAAVVPSGETLLTKSDVAGSVCAVNLFVKVMVVSVLLVLSVVLVVATVASISVIFCVFRVLKWVVCALVGVVRAERVFVLVA